MSLIEAKQEVFQNNSVTLVWTEERVQHLIELFKEWPNLWDPKHPAYRNRIKKMEAMKTIANIMDIDTVEIERKINILLTQFRRVHKKVLTLKKAGKEGEIERNLWYGYRLLSFLEDRFDVSICKDIQEEEYQIIDSNSGEDDYVILKDAVTGKTVVKDEYDLYGEQIALKLKKMDPINRVETQHRINCIIHEVEMNLLRNGKIILSPDVKKIRIV